jgi:4-oxalomesaconate hydratase
MIQGKTMMVVSAHAADYVWRSGGTIAKYIAEGAKVNVQVLSFGSRGESNDLWKQEGATAEKVRDLRRQETKEAASILGLKENDIEFWDLGDYPIELSGEHEERLIRNIRKLRPDIIITHDRFDALNPDHNRVSEFVLRCSIMSNSEGVRLDGTAATKQMRLFGFEPHQTEISHYVPGSFIDITSYYEKKIAAMKCFQAQKHLIEYYTERAFMRGNHAARISGNNVYKYAESFANFFPVVGPELY